MEPLPEDEPEKFVFAREIVGNAIPPSFIPACEKGFREACNSGGLTGHPVQVSLDQSSGTRCCVPRPESLHCLHPRAVSVSVITLLMRSLAHPLPPLLPGCQDVHHTVLGASLLCSACMQLLIHEVQVPM